MSDTNIDQADLELSQEKFTNPNDEAEYQLWLDSLADEEEIMAEIAASMEEAQIEHDLHDDF